MKTFWQWIINEDGRRTGLRAMLYPPSYGASLYPPGAYMSHAADAVVHFDNPEDANYHADSGGLFDITKLTIDYPENKYPKSNMPSDTSTQFKIDLPVDSSSQPSTKYYHPEMNHKPTWGEDKTMPSDDPNNSKNSLSSGSS